MLKQVFLTLMMAIVVTGCAGTKTSENKHVSQEHMTLATNWVQTAAEWQALCLQSYQWATIRLKEALKQKKSNKPAAVIVDIDETILDNSPFQARSIQNGTSYPVGWSEWVEESKATFIPGAQAFLATAKKLGVRVFYITNRKIKEAPATLKNLQALGVSVVNEDLLPKDKENGKGGRRNQVAQKHEIVMLIGDNLADFDDAFDMAPMAKRSEAVARFAKEWGSKWVVLPNPMYGDWESAMYEFNFSLKHEEKSALRHKNLRSLK